MPLFNVVGIDEKSGRAVRKIYRGFDPEEVKAIALRRDQLFAKWIEPHPYKSATEAQKRRLMQLGYEAADGLNVREAGDLLRTIRSGDRPVDHQSQAYARYLRIETTVHTGQKQMFDAILRQLMQPGKEQHLAAWFTFRVYRTLAADDDRAIICGPDHPVVQRIAQYLIQDVAVTAAIKSYRTGREWIRFGHFIDAQGQVQRGGRMDTLAYRQAKACWEKAFASLPQLRPSPHRNADPASTKTSLLPPLLTAPDPAIRHRRQESFKAS